MTAIASIPAATRWTVDKVHSNVGFSVKHMVVSTYRGRFEDFDAALTANDDGTLQLAGTVRADSIVVKDENLAAHIKAPDFFDVEQYPEIAFDSTLIREDGGALTVEGTLTIKGHTQPIKATGTITEPLETVGGRVELGVELEAVVDRRDYGLDWQATLPSGGFALGHEVKLQVELEFAQA